MRQAEEGKLDARPAPGAGPLMSDTGELSWDTEDRVVTINTARSKGVIGSLTRRDV